MKYKVTGSNTVNGTIKISGSKNASLPIIVAATLTKECVIIENVPLISDVINMIRLLDNIDVITKYEYATRRLIIHAKKIKSIITSDYVKKIRASYYLIGALISRKHQIEMAYPGGCAFTTRPIDIHLSVFEQQGVKIDVGETLKFKVKDLKPTIIDFPRVTVGGTINAILSSVYTKGETILNNVAVEPEVIDVINFIKQMGGDITFISNQSISIKGVKKLHGTTYKIMPDRIEAGSYLLLAMGNPNSKLTLTDVNLLDLQNVTKVIEQMGGEFIAKKNELTLTTPTIVTAINLKTGPYPAFPTDLQPIITTVLLKGNGTSVVEDLIYHERISHLKELKKMNASIYYENKKIIIEPSILKAGIVNASDLRCGFALIVASNMAKGTTTINNAEYITRGYEECLHKLSSINIECNKQI